MTSLARCRVWIGKSEAKSNGISGNYTISVKMYDPGVAQAQLAADRSGGGKALTRVSMSYEVPGNVPDFE